MNPSFLSPLDLSEALRRIRRLLDRRVQRRRRAEDVQTCWRIGRILHRALPLSGDWSLLRAALAAAWPGEDRLPFPPAYWRLRYRFFQCFPDWSAELAELSWSHYLLLLRLQSPRALEFYRREALANGWSTRELARQIAARDYERRLEAPGDSGNPLQLIRDPYILEFLELEAADLLEKDLETALMNKLRAFLQELGGGFAFVARQKRITTATGKTFYIDLVFYNYLLKCFVLIDLKAGELSHADIGQMDMYVRLYDARLRRPGDNPTLGIILCTEKDQTLIQYSVLGENRQLFASTYQFRIPESPQGPEEEEEW